MLRGFDSWPDVLQHVRSGGILYYDPHNSGPLPAIPVVRQGARDDQVRLWIRPPYFSSGGFTPTIADDTFLDKLYRWEALKRAAT